MFFVCVFFICFYYAVYVLFDISVCEHDLNVYAVDHVFVKKPFLVSLFFFLFSVCSYFCFSFHHDIRSKEGRGSEYLEGCLFFSLF